MGWLVYTAKQSNRYQKMKDLTIALCIAALFVSSCQETEIPTLPSPSAQYVSWTEGDWWVYEWARYNYNVGDTTVFSIDTIFALADTVINGNVYRTLSGPLYPWRHDSLFHVRDSSGFIVEPNGKILLSYTNFTDTLESHLDSTWGWFTRMREDPSPTVVPVGSFSTINYQTIFQIYGHEYYCGDSIIYSDRQFAENVGMVRMSYHYATFGPCIDHVYNLISYDVQ